MNRLELLNSVVGGAVVQLNEQKKQAWIYLTPANATYLQFRTAKDLLESNKDRLLVSVDEGITTVKNNSIRPRPKGMYRKNRGAVIGVRIPALFKTRIVKMATMNKLSESKFIERVVTYCVNQNNLTAKHLRLLDPTFSQIEIKEDAPMTIFYILNRVPSAAPRYSIVRIAEEDLVREGLTLELFIGKPEPTDGELYLGAVQYLNSDGSSLQSFPLTAEGALAFCRAAKRISQNVWEQAVEISSDYGFEGA